MRIVLWSLLTVFTCCQLSGYTHTLKLSKIMKNMQGTYNVFVNGQRDALFQFTIGNDQKVSVPQKTIRDADVSVDNNKYITFKNKNPEQACLTKITILDESNKLQGVTIATERFRTSSSGPSFCGDYVLRLTVDDKQKALKFKDDTKGLPSGLK